MVIFGRSPVPTFCIASGMATVPHVVVVTSAIRVSQPPHNIVHRLPLRRTFLFLDDEASRLQILGSMIRNVNTQ